MKTRRADRPPAPGDQADGLRQLFAVRDLRFVPLVHNPQVTGAGAVMERLCAGFAQQGMHTLVVDAADSASLPHELAAVDLSACVETLSTEVSYLAARGLALHYLDNRASLVGFLGALGRAAPRADVVLLHAGAGDLRRMFVGRHPCPVLLVGSRPDSLMPAYAAIKLLSHALGPLAFDLVIASDQGPELARRMGQRLRDCADRFLGAALRHLVLLDPLTPPHEPPAADLSRLACAQLAPGVACSADASGTPLAAPSFAGAAKRRPLAPDPRPSAFSLS